MAVIKHIASKNADYGESERYLIFQHNEYAEKDQLIELQDSQREDFSNRRDYERELRTVSANIDMILGKNREQEQQIEKGKNL